MIPSRETIFAALFALVNTPAMLVSGGGLFNTITRRPKLWSEYNNSADFPVLGMVEPDEQYEYRQGKASPANRTLKAQFWIYTAVPQDDAVIPSTILNNCIDAIENALTPVPSPSNGGIQTLGNLVQSAWISDAPKKAPGYTDVNGLAIIPVSILVP